MQQWVYFTVTFFFLFSYVWLYGKRAYVIEKSIDIGALVYSIYMNMK
jgi:hypothetical protein